MAEQPPEAWIGQEVTVFYGVEAADRMAGTLDSVSERGLVLLYDEQDEEQRTYFVPWTSVVRLRLGAVPRRRSTVTSF